MTKKMLFIISVIMLAVIVCLTYYMVHKKLKNQVAISYDMQLPNPPGTPVRISLEERAVREMDTKVFFDYAQEELPKLQQELAQVEKQTPVDQEKTNSLQNKIKTYKAATIIAAGDIGALKQAASEQLVFKNGQIWVNGDRFNDTMDGTLASRILGSENALGFVLYHGLLNKTGEDDEKTLEMLRVLLDKKLDPNIFVGEVLWIKPSPSATHSADYVRLFPLLELAYMFGPSGAPELLIKYGATPIKTTK